MSSPPPCPAASRGPLHALARPQRSLLASQGARPRGAVPACPVAGRGCLERGAGAEAWTQANHDSGLWAIRLLTVSLAVTPLRQVLRRPRVAELRRMAGVAVAAYAVLHLLLYAGDEAFVWAKVVSEIASRTYLTIASRRWSGCWRWRRPRPTRRCGGWGRGVATAAPRGVRGGRLALLHFAMQEKVDVTEPVLMAGLFCGWPAIAGGAAGRRAGVAVLLGLAAGAAAAARGSRPGGMRRPPGWMRGACWRPIWMWASGCGPPCGWDCRARGSGAAIGAEAGAAARPAAGRIDLLGLADDRSSARPRVSARRAAWRLRAKLSARRAAWRLRAKLSARRAGAAAARETRDPYGPCQRHESLLVPGPRRGRRKSGKPGCARRLSGQATVRVPRNDAREGQAQTRARRQGPTASPPPPHPPPYRQQHGDGETTRA